MKQEHWWVGPAIAGIVATAIGFAIIAETRQLFTESPAPAPSASVTVANPADVETPPRHDPGHAVGVHGHINEPPNEPRWEDHRATLWWSTSSTYRCYLSVELQRGRTAYVDVPEEWCADLKSEVAHGAR